MSARAQLLTDDRCPDMSSAQASAQCLGMCQADMNIDNRQDYKTYIYMDTEKCTLNALRRTYMRTLMVCRKLLHITCGLSYITCNT